jgi:hypothetical protein
VFTVVINFRDVQDVKLVDGRLILIQTLKNKVRECPTYTVGMQRVA